MLDDLIAINNKYILINFIYIHKIKMKFFKMYQITFIKKSLFSFLLFQTLFLITISAQVSTDKTIESVMELKKERQKLNPKIDGYRIQLYNGLETESNQVKTKFLTLFPDVKAEIIYKAPEWKVQVGNFRTRLEADKSLQNIKLQFPGSLVVIAKINP